MDARSTIKQGPHESPARNPTPFFREVSGKRRSLQNPILEELAGYAWSR